MIQYQVAISPLVDFWADTEPSLALRIEALESLQSVLVSLAGENSRWVEEPGTALEAETLDVAALYALRAAAAWYEKHGSMDDFEATDAPWDHPIFEAFDEGNSSTSFRQLLETDAEVTAFVPTKLPEVYFLSEYGDGDAASEEIAVGSLPNLLRELDTFAIILQVPQGLDPYNSDTPAFDTDVDHNAPVNWGLTMLRRCAYRALKRGLPLVVYAVEVEES